MKPPLTKQNIYDARRELGPYASPGDVAKHLGYFLPSVVWHLNPTYLQKWRIYTAKMRYHRQLLRVIKQIRAKGYALGRTPKQTELRGCKKIIAKAGGMYHLVLLAGLKPNLIREQRNPRYGGPKPPYWKALCAHSEIKSWSALKRPPSHTV